MALLDYLSKILPNIKKQAQPEYYFGINIKHSSVTGSIWGIEGGKVRIISVIEKKFLPPADISENPQELIEKANIALDEALGDFEPEPEKILFGVPDLWLADDQLKPKYSKVLKQLTRELDIVPLAYVASSHAICHLLQRQEGVPITTILVEIEDLLTVSVVKAGKVLGSKELARGDSLPKSIEKALLSFGEIEVLPAKILIFGSGELSHFKEELVSFNWMGQLPFLHLPKIEELEEEVGIKSLSFAGASEINPHVHLDHQTVPIKRTDNLKRGNVWESQKAHSKNLGFVKKEETAVSENETGREDDFIDSVPEIYQKNISSTHGLGAIEKFTHSGALKKIPNFLGLFGNFGMGLIIPLVVLVVILGAYVLLPKATVVMFVDPKVLEKETQIVADPKITTMDEANKQIAGKIVETTVDGSAKSAATGKKQIGESAKGKVVIYNATSKEVNLSASVILQSGDGKKFKLSSAVKIASKSASAADPPTKSGVADAVAVDIGPDGNISGGTELKVGDFSKADIVAEVDTAFSGGVSKDVTVVTSEDQKKLLASLTVDLKKQAQEEIQGKLTGDMKILEETFVEKALKQSFSKSAGDQASEFSLSLSLNLKGTAYSDSDLKSIVGKLVETTVPDGFELDLSRTETQATVSKVEKDGKIIFTAKFKAKLMPKFDLNKLKSQITFKTPLQVEEILKAHENVIGADIKLSPNLPGPLQRLPILPQNINLEISSN